MVTAGLCRSWNSSQAPQHSPQPPSTSILENFPGGPFPSCRGSPAPTSTASRASQAAYLCLLSLALGPRPLEPCIQACPPSTSSLLVQERKGVFLPPEPSTLGAEQHPPLPPAQHPPSLSGHSWRSGLSLHRPSTPSFCSLWGNLGSKSCLVHPGSWHLPRPPSRPPHSHPGKGSGVRWTGH